MKLVNQQCKGCQLCTPKPNMHCTLLPDHCIFYFDVAVDVMIMKKYELFMSSTDKLIFIRHVFYLRKIHILFGIYSCLFGL